MRFHVLGVCHTVTSLEYLACAFTQKVLKFCEMMFESSEEDRKIKSSMSAGEFVKHRSIHYVIHYGHERSTVKADEHVTVMTDDILSQTYGNYDWKKDFFKNQEGDLVHRLFVSNTFIELSKRRLPGDFILCFWGAHHQAIALPFMSECLVVEPGIGYIPESSFADFKVYESYAVMHNHYGIKQIVCPPWYDCVIPNYFNERDFRYEKEKKNYFLYLGRITKSKGLDVIIHLAKTIGFRLLIAGQGSLTTEFGETDLPVNIEWVGYADVETRKELMANARALLIASSYIEPFGGVVVEAMMSGTPVISCDWGVFNETILHGITGYRCRTIDQFEWAIRNIDNINPESCRQWAHENFSLEKIREMYEEYFDMLLKLKFDQGFTLQDPSRTRLDWLYKDYPQKSTGIKSKPKILVFTDTKWVFGRIFQAIQKYSTKFNIDLINWENGPPHVGVLNQYDLIYTTVWDIARRMELLYPSVKEKLIFSGHGKVDFVKMKFSDLSNLHITNTDIDNFELDPHLLEWLQNRKHGFSVVSTELLNLFKDRGLNVHLTQCAADPDLFYPKLSNKNSRLQVLCGLPKITTTSAAEKVHGYDAKRKDLIEKLQEKLINQNIDIVFPEDFLTTDQMANFYNLGDIYICLSHSEGNPLGAFEAGASGLVVISTKVGEMPEFIKDGHNGFLLENSDVENNAIECLIKLEKDRKLLQEMKINMLNVCNDWTWSKKIIQWEDFFTACLNL